MIFYTLQGPVHNLEIHEDKMYLMKKSWSGFFSKNNIEDSWGLEELTHFEISVPKFLFTGKISWKTTNGRNGSFRFSTSMKMMKKIELYLQKKIIKNHQREQNLMKQHLKISRHSAGIAA